MGLAHGAFAHALMCLNLSFLMITSLYKGTLVHYLVHRLRRGLDPEQLLQEDTSRQLYKDLCVAVK